LPNKPQPKRRIIERKGVMDEKGRAKLKEIFLFQLLDSSEIEEFARVWIERMYGAGMRIFSERNSGDAMYIITKGLVRITREEDGKEKEITTLRPGDFFGEIALFEYVARTATATALEDTYVLEITRERFNDFFSEKPHIAAKILYQMMIEMSRRLRRVSSLDDWERPIIWI
jgi:CRP-like cAMP-binding protein